MLGFDFFRTGGRRYRPKTPHSAMKAVEAQILPMEAFISMGTSVKPLGEEPYDFLEIESMLSRNDLDLSTNVALVEIFRKLTKSPDQEKALFAAESMNLIEGRYNQAIEEKKEELRDNKQPHLLLELARLYYEYSELYRQVGTMKDFYLREAHRYIQMLPDNLEADTETVRLIVMIYVELGFYEKALLALQQFANQQDEIAFLFLRAEVEFRRRNFIDIFQICTWLLQRQDQLSHEQELLIAHWLGHE